MERTKAKIELPELEMEVLSYCIFTESFESLCAEVQLVKDVNVVADAIKNLIHRKLLVAVNQNMGNLKWVYDTDKMRDSQFRATALGLAYLQS